MCIWRKTEKRFGEPVYKPHTGKLYILRHWNKIIYMCYIILYTNRIIIETESKSIALTHIYMIVHFSGLEQALQHNLFLNVMS